MKAGAPVIGILDCAGVRLQESTDALNALGEIYFKQSMAKSIIPQISAVFGNCGGGLAVFTALSDFTFMEETSGKLFVNHPDTLDGNYTAKNDTASAKFQASESGLVDFKGDEESVIAAMRELVAMLPSNNNDISMVECKDSLNRKCSGIEGAAKDTSIFLSTVADDNEFFEVKADYAKSMVTGFIRLDGMTVGCVANRSEVVGEDGKVTEKFGTIITYSLGSAIRGLGYSVRLVADF